MENSIEFYKMSGTGNDFIIFDGRQASVAKKLNSLNRTELTRQICIRSKSVGADGMVIIESSSEHDFSWDFYNADGSSAEMCGNAARCVGWLVKTLGHSKSEVTFRTLAGVVSTQVHADESVSVQMPVVGTQLIQHQINSVNGTSVNTGVPHFVIETDAPFDSKKDLARELRSHVHFGLKGTNVTLFKRLDSKKLESVTFERGVEDFTLACGTGAVAAGLVFAEGQLKEEVTVHVPGGEVFVSQHPVNGRPMLRGKTTLVYKGDLNLGVLL